MKFWLQILLDSGLQTSTKLVKHNQGRITFIYNSFDKQYLRDYLLSINFDKKNGVELPELVIKNTIQKYSEVCKILTGSEPVW